MDIKTNKSVIEHNTLGKLFKYKANLDNINQSTEAFNSLLSGAEALSATVNNSNFDTPDVSMNTHRQYSDGKSFGYLDCQLSDQQHLNVITNLSLFRGCQENSVRLFITDRNDLANPIFQNKFCFLLGSLNNKKIDIYVGSSCYGAMALCNLGCLFDALECSAADLTMHVCGRCGMSESMMWLHANKKCITQYGSLYFSGVGRILESYPMWREYYERAFIKAKTFNLISDQDVVDLMTTNNLIYISATDTLAALNK